MNPPEFPLQGLPKAITLAAALVRLAVVLCLTSRCLAATGDISSVTIRATGWDADVRIVGFDANTAYAFVDPTTGTSKFRLRVTTNGYDAFGNATTPTRMVYGTAIIRRPYPNNSSLDETVIGSDVIVRLALSSRIRSSDSIVADIAADAFSDGPNGTSNSASSLPCANVSSLAHPTCFAQWAQRPYERWQSSPTLAVTARHMYGVAAVEIILADQHSNSITTLTTKQTRLRPATGLYAEEWAATCDLSPLMQGDQITARFRVYPTIGDSGAIYDSHNQIANDDNRTLGICDYPYFNDKDATADTYAVVNFVSGDDNTGLSSASLALATANPYRTIGRALTVGEANIIFCRAGTGNVLGSAVTSPPSFGYWRQIKAYPGDGPVILQLTGTAPYNTPQLSYEGVICQLAAGANWFDGVNGARTISFKTCAFDHNGAPPLGMFSRFAYRSACAYFEGCTFTDASRFGLGDNWVARLCHWFDGCSMPSSAPTGVIGLHRFVACASTNLGLHSSDEDAGTGPLSDPLFIEFNSFMNYSNTSGPCLSLFAGATSSSVGVSVVGNVVEVSSGSQRALSLSGDNSTNTLAHALLWNNTFAGQRANVCYNESGTEAHLKHNVSVQCNAFGAHVGTGSGPNIKADVFGAPNGNRVGNWASLYGVDYAGNAQVDTDGFNSAFPGLRSASTMDTEGESHSNLGICEMHFADDRSVSGAGGGGGDYSPLPGSALINLVPAGYARVTWDLNGVAVRNDGTGTAGAIQVRQTACYANCDNSVQTPILNVLDFSCFLNRFAAGDPYANCDGSSVPPVLNVLDFGCFLNAFAGGCP